LNFWFENNPSGNPASSSLLKHPFKLLHFGEGLNLFFLVVVVVGGGRYVSTFNTVERKLFPEILTCPLQTS
jgi:hypothetical protein